MVRIKTYQDLLEVGEIEKDRMDFVLSAINEHKGSEAYKMAKDAVEYAEGRNATIMKYQKLLYTLSGKAVPDNFSANHKCASGFFKRFLTQQTAFLLGNGVNFTEESTKEKLGKTFDSVIYHGAKSALTQSVAFGFYNKDHIEIYNFTDFVPLYDEEDGALKAGIRFWQIDNSKPLRATLFEIDGYTDYIKRKDEDIAVKVEKRPYIQIVKSSEADGEVIYDGKNYPSFPIVPLWANHEKQSELIGKREQIDCYDLIKSGFANDLDEAAIFYWTIQNAGGMTDEDLARFKQKMKTLGVANIDGGDEGAKAEAHTVDLPYQAREVYLERLEKDLYKDFMALDVEKIAAGSVTATQIDASYEPLNEKVDEFEMCVTEFINGILTVAGIDDEPTYSRSKVSNKKEEIEMILACAEYFDDDYITEKLLTILGDIDRVEEVIKARQTEEVERYEVVEEPVIVEEVIEE